VTTNHKYTGALISALCLCAFVVFPGVGVSQPQQSSTEAEALAAIKQATNPTLKLAAAEDFLARFPNSGARLRIAELIAAEILQISNGAVALTLLERAQAIFTSEQEREVLKPATLAAYVIGGRSEEAFALASELLTKNPDDLDVLTRMNQAGINERVKRNPKLVELALQWGLKAIAIIENDKKPASIDEEKWSNYKRGLWFLYRNTAILYLTVPNTKEAKARSLKASTFVPHEPYNFAVLGMALDLEYTGQLEAYEKMAEGQPKQEARKKLDALLDSLIEAFARAVGLATGRPQYQDLTRTLVPALTNYYKTRNNQSTAGLQQLINQYRPRP
jgi:hypothetical protein